MEWRSAFLSHNAHADNTRHDNTLIAQGPALYFYNNASFSEADFRNLASIGQSSKLAKLNTTGRFGLGFNATYHYTYTPTTHTRTHALASANAAEISLLTMVTPQHSDLPQLVSQDSIVMFDPHTTYVPGATRGAPGIRIRFTRPGTVPFA